MMSLVQKILVDSVMNLQWHKMNKKDVVGVITFGLIGVLPTNHIIILQWHTRFYEKIFHLILK